MYAEQLALTLTAAGELLIGYSVLRVHAKMEKEHRLDKKVISEIDKEKRFVYSGILLIIAGLIINLFF